MTAPIIITISENYQIEVMESGNHYPMVKQSNGTFGYFAKSANKHVSFRTEKAARQFIVRQLAEKLTEQGQGEFAAKLLGTYVSPVTA